MERSSLFCVRKLETPLYERKVRLADLHETDREQLEKRVPDRSDMKMSVGRSNHSRNEPTAEQ
jgi:hypothetical protein